MAERRSLIAGVEGVGVDPETARAFIVQERPKPDQKSEPRALPSPVRVVPDPIRGRGGVLVLCEVFNSDGTPHESNARARLREVLEAGAADSDPYFGFEQEYALLRDGRPLGFPVDGEPAPQGPYYCSVGADVALS